MVTIVKNKNIENFTDEAVAHALPELFKELVDTRRADYQGKILIHYLDDGFASADLQSEIKELSNFLEIEPPVLRYFTHNGWVSVVDEKQVKVIEGLELVEFGGAWWEILPATRRFIIRKQCDRIGQIYDYTFPTSGKKSQRKLMTYDGVGADGTKFEEVKIDHRQYFKGPDGQLWH